MYGSSRLGIINLDTDVEEPLDTEGLTEFERGRKFFELSNHLGNVLVTVSDKKTGVSSNGTTIDYFTADIVNANDYYPKGIIVKILKPFTDNTLKELLLCKIALFCSKQTFFHPKWLQNDP